MITYKIRSEFSVKILRNVLRKIEVTWLGKPLITPLKLSYNMSLALLAY
ncbi:hypothetical protein KUL150_08220 [Alteromonas sp. KUL150]|nr:hypothetical protein KUL150_08220 [Alteromonas sp. KUL150]